MTDSLPLDPPLANLQAYHVDRIASNYKWIMWARELAKGRSEISRSASKEKVQKKKSYLNDNWECFTFFPLNTVMDKQNFVVGLRTWVHPYLRFLAFLNKEYFLSSDTCSSVVGFEQCAAESVFGYSPKWKRNGKKY